jgi:hypothetical protein
MASICIRLAEAVKVTPLSSISGALVTNQPSLPVGKDLLSATNRFTGQKLPLLTNGGLVNNPIDVISQMKCGDGPPTSRALIAECDVNLRAQRRIQV